MRERDERKKGNVRQREMGVGGHNNMNFSLLWSVDFPSHQIPDSVEPDESNLRDTSGSPQSHYSREAYLFTERGCYISACIGVACAVDYYKILTMYNALAGVLVKELVELMVLQSIIIFLSAYFCFLFLLVAQRQA